MRWITKLRLRVRSLLRGRRVEQELDEELRYHLEHLVDDYVAAGMHPEEARYAALREMGAIEPRKEECRDARGLALADSLRQDLTYALRALRKSPGFTTVAILSLTLGIGANTTIFTFVNAVLLRPLPYPDSDRLVTLREQPRGSAVTMNVHPLNFVEWRARARSFEALALVQTPPLNVIGRDGAEQIVRLQTTAELFRVFGVRPALGRAFTDEEMQPAPEDVVILGHGFWQRWFGGDPGVLGKRLMVQNGSLTIVGVAAPGLRIGLTEPDAYTPLRIDPANPGAIGSHSFQCYGRLKSGVSLDAVRAEMTVIASALARQYPIDEGHGVFVSGLHDHLVQAGRPALRLLMAVVAIVLVIACANLAGLLIARGMGRCGELAVRASLGASRGRLVRQLVIESLVLATFGGAAGLILAYWATQALVILTAGALTVGSAEPIRLDVICLVFTLVVSTVTALVFGLVPAWQASRVEPQSALHDQTRRSTADRRHHRMRRMLVVTEVALAIVLLVGAGLLLRTFSNLVRVNPGFQPAETITMSLFLGLRPPDARITLVDRILDRVEAVPGVKAASTIQFLPLAGMNCSSGFWLDGQMPVDPTRGLPTDCSLVSPAYFAVMGIPLLEGRPFDRRDRSGTPRVAIVNQSFARQYFPDGRVLGRRIRVHAPNEPLADIIGVAGDVRHNGLTSEPAPTVFLLHAQRPGYITNLVVRTRSVSEKPEHAPGRPPAPPAENAGNSGVRAVRRALLGARAASLGWAPGGDVREQAAAVRRAIQEVDPTQAVSAVKTMDQYVGDTLARPRMYAALVACFAAIAAMLAAMGLYGLIAYIVTQRTHEIGIRLALGAARGKVFLDLFGQGARLVVSGLVVGVVAAVGLRGMVSTLLFGVTPGDPVSYAMAAAAFLGVALAAVAIPARRASRVEPISALRYE